MPELPEVETIRMDLVKNRVQNQIIKKINIIHSSIIRPLDASTFINELEDQVIQKILRKGKYLIFLLQDLYLVIHLKMTGHIFLKDHNYKLQKHEHLEIFLDNNIKLVYYDPRRFGRFYLTKNIDELLNKIKYDAIVDPIPFDVFAWKLKSLNKNIKAALLDQTFIAGIGNIYADEILFSAGILPNLICKNLLDSQIKKLYESISDVLKRGIKNRGTSLGKNDSNFSSIFKEFGENQNHLFVYSQKNCKKCDSKIVKTKIAQRSTYFCIKCQTLL